MFPDSASADSAYGSRIFVTSTLDINTMQIPDPFMKFRYAVA